MGAAGWVGCERGRWEGEGRRWATDDGRCDERATGKQIWTKREEWGSRHARRTRNALQLGHS